MTIYGPVDVSKHAALKNSGHELRVFVDGVDITDRCRFFDDTPGARVAEIFRVDNDGRKYVDPSTDTAAVDRVYEFEVVEVPQACQ